jgi:hypothetical protein
VGISLWVDATSNRRIGTARCATNQTRTLDRMHQATLAKIEQLPKSMTRPTPTPQCPRRDP